MKSKNVGSFPVSNICGKVNVHTLLCLIVWGGGRVWVGQIANFGKKNPQVHLIIIREPPKNKPLSPI